MKTAQSWAILSLLASTAAVVACSSDGGTSRPGVLDPGKPGELVDNGFESDDPQARASGAGRGAVDSAGGADAGVAAPTANGAEDSASAQRTIEEADIVKLEGTKLYALSRYGGLAIIDVSDPDALKVVGRKRTEGIPFEMYVKNGKVHVMLNDTDRYIYTDDGMGYGQWVQTSEIEVYDVGNPAAITEVTHYDVPGSIADSRLVGDTLYLVTYENGYCWSCAKTPSTIITSFNLGATNVTKVDSLSYSGSTNSYSWKRSVSATNQRMYVAGPEWNWQPGATNASSIIQVVDISDISGKLKKGADVAIAGQINSRWQIDEYDGVLRVVSQYGNGWGSSGQVNPKVQTFTVTSATQITPLGSTELQMPQPESLQSVRFDGPRGYAITSRRTDPLFTIDLSNPAAPKQAGELAMPGWIFHMEPRGDRLVGFGYDDTNNTELAVSLFDVSNMATPKMLTRVKFGNGWGSVAEDQDRIHKSVRVLDDQGLVLVPFASYGRWNGGSCSSPQSGIQLIDYTHDSLTLRGLAPQYGMPRRAIVTGNNRLLAVSDRNVTSFDITSRDNPIKKSEIDMSNPAYRTTVVGNHFAQLTNDWWSGAVSLSLTPKDGADDANVAGKIDLGSLAPSSQYYCGTGPSSWTAWYQARIFGEGNYVYLTVPVYSYDYSGTTNSRSGKVIVASIDVSNPAAPTLVGKTEMQLTTHDNDSGGYYYGYGFWDGYGWYSYYSGALVGSGEGIVKHGTKLAYLEVDHEYVKRALPTGGYTYDTKVHRKLHVADMANPSAPSVSSPIDLGESLGVTPLTLADGVVYTSRWVKGSKKGKVRFYADRVDLGGSAPIHMSSINTPGSLVSVDVPSSRFVTSDYYVKRSPANDWQDCRNLFGNRAYFDYDGKECIDVTRDLKLSDVTGAKVQLRQTLALPSQNIGGVLAADDRIYVTRYSEWDYSTCNGGGSCTPKVVELGGLWAIGGIRAGAMTITSTLNGNARWPLAASGSKVALYTESGMAIYDTSVATPTLLKDVTLRGYGYASHVSMDEHRAVASLGEFGLQTIDY